MSKLSKEDLNQAMQAESKEFETFYFWLEEHMQPAFFEEFEPSQVMTIVHNLMGFNLQGNFVQIHFDTCSIVLCLESVEADLQILKNYTHLGIQSYQTFVSNASIPGLSSKLRIAILKFTQKDNSIVIKSLKNKEELIPFLSPSFLRTLNKKRLSLILEMFFRARTNDPIQYEVKYNENWSEKGIPSMQIVFAWRNTQKHGFLYRLAKLIYRHNLVMKRVNAAYVSQEKCENILLMSLALHGQENKPAWEATDIQDFLQELATLKYFEDNDLIESTLVETKLLRGNLANLVRTLASLTHQLLLHSDANLYSPLNIEEALIRHPELTLELTRIFEDKFHPLRSNLQAYNDGKTNFLSLADKLDTGNLPLDIRRKNVLRTMLYVIDSIKKTNFYTTTPTAFSFRLSSEILDKLPFDREHKFPELPFALFFIKGKSFFGFHIRFKELSRGGIRTIFPFRPEQASWELINIFSECYNLAYTQQKKNKDIPEGGAKGVIFVEPLEELAIESMIYKKELLRSGLSDKEVEEKLQTFQKDERLVYLYQSQRAYVESILTLINCEDDGTLKAKNIVDYYKKPEYLYFGPDENLHNVMIEWIAEYSKHLCYKPGIAFISSKPTYGINHKEFGVTSLGVNVYMHKLLEAIGIDPKKDPFTIKISGGPDGDVAGNQICNLYRFYPKTAKLLAITDISGTIFDPNGLDLAELTKLFKEEKSIKFYPPEKLSSKGFLLDLTTKQGQTAYAQQTLCYRKVGDKVIKDWMNGNETHYLYSHNLHETVTDIFIPAGGRPRTLNQSNFKDFLTPDGTPTSRAIVEGANLYLTSDARAELEKKGVLIIKDSSANKGGVICSSLEVLSGLILSEEEFLKEKPILMKEVIAFIEEKALLEANLLLSMKDQKPLTEVSDLISKRINTFKSQILDYLEDKELSNDPNNPLIRALLDYALPLFRTKYQSRLLTNIPLIHKKAIIACRIASHMVYTKGLSWTPTIVDVLPLIL